MNRFISCMVRAAVLVIASVMVWWISDFPDILFLSLFSIAVSGVFMVSAAMAMLEAFYPKKRIDPLEEIMDEVGEHKEFEL